MGDEDDDFTILKSIETNFFSLEISIYRSLHKSLLQIEFHVLQPLPSSISSARVHYSVESFGTVAWRL